MTSDADAPAGTSVGLKEWAVVCRALGEGRQIFLLRKGGIRDPDGEFRLEHSSFLLLPVREHQNAGDVKPEFRSWLTEAPGAAGPEGPFPVHLWAEADEVAPAASPAALARALERSVWTRSFLDKRLAYKPEKPLCLVFLKVRRRPAPWTVPADPAYAGCVSWVPLRRPVLPEELQPVLSDADYAREKESVLSALAA